MKLKDDEPLTLIGQVTRTCHVMREQLTYRLERVDDLMTIVCLLCDSQSAHPDDIDNRYCARCHLFHDAVQLARQLTTHECHEWMTAVGDCAVCGAVTNKK